MQNISCRPSPLQSQALASDGCKELRGAHRRRIGGRVHGAATVEAERPGSAGATGRRQAVCLAAPGRRIDYGTGALAVREANAKRKEQGRAQHARLPTHWAPKQC